MSGCSNQVYLAIVILIAGVVSLVVHWRRQNASKHDQAEVGATTGSRWNGKIIGIILIVIAIVMGATGSYMICSSTVSACPPAIGGNGYVCAAPDSGCFDITPGKCKTVAGYWFWESSCECKCE